MVGSVSSLFILPVIMPVRFTPALWRSFIRPLILMRDNYTCRVCSHHSKTNHVHHLDGNRANNRECNLITLCPSCHANVSKIDFSVIQSRIKG